MKKLAIILLAAAFVMLPSCKNQKKAVAEDPVAEEVSQKEKYITGELKLNAEALAESVSKLRPAGFVRKVNDTEYALTDKEKMVKPDYLFKPGNVDNFVTLSQKYRALGVLFVDQAIATYYDIPVTEYNAAISKLLAEINDPVLNDYAKAQKGKESQAMSAFGSIYDAEVEANRVNYFWECTVGMLVEQIFICTQNIEKFMPMFDDQSASDVTYNFILVHENLRQLVEFYPELQPLNEVLEPLYVINAISVDQLRSQLTELKGEIGVARAFMLK